MRNKFLASIICVFLSVSLVTIIFPIKAIGQEEKQVKYEEERQLRKEEQKRFWEEPVTIGNLILTGIVGTFFGVDSNVHLDSSKKRDTFEQVDAGVTATYPLADWLNARASHDLYYTNYNEYTDYSTFDNYTKVGLEASPFDFLTAEGWYGFEYLYYPKDDEGTYYAHVAGAGLRNQLLENIYLKSGYELIYRKYTGAKKQDGAGVNLDDKRHDYRYLTRSELGARVFDANLRLSYEFYKNDSNDAFFDYYDYDSYKVLFLVSRKIIGNLYGLASFGRQWRYYDERVIGIGSTEKEKDKTWLANASAFYQITPYLSLVGTYSYRDNTSNNPLSEYVNFITSAGVYFTF